MNSYLVETQDESAPIKYKILVKNNIYKLHYFHIIVTSGSMVIASTNPAICGVYPDQDILNYYQANSLETLRAFGFGKYKGESYSRVILKDPTYVAWCLENVKGFSLHHSEQELLSYELSRVRNSINLKYDYNF